MPEWALALSLLGAVVLGYVLGRAGRSGSGHNWWQEMSISNNAARNQAVNVLTDRFALGEIDADEFRTRMDQLQSAHGSALKF